MIPTVKIVIKLTKKQVVAIKTQIRVFIDHSDLLILISERIKLISNNINCNPIIEEEIKINLFLLLVIDLIC